ncbi:sugar ABC transporter ATP-binding protein [Chelativorans sp. AA-79]|uniref:sugar ABC transporter ATP-binding protein n=1 Tax=Chelativorans sp. AA-79 TaxID=3028735 RepID=UPI0023F707B0|nr:sugar ABC transporter ATP-binding protein [Chelativorans sp. AA-79]WEX08994.1 sugar ABC transporter ATP-binding protein [Chelativorans sp. AA-79]
MQVPNAPVVARLSGCSKHYPGVVALQDADFEMRAGEVRALLGKNGAGKSTMIRLLTGAELPDTGSVVIDGRPLEERLSRRAAEAHERGVRVVYQELSLVSDMSIAENLFLGRWPRRNGIIDHREMKRQAHAALSRLGFAIDPERTVASLSPAERQLIEIARVLIGDPKIVILDEPTSSLADAEAKKVLAAVQRIAAEGISVIYVSHRMGEIRQIADAVTIMRDGRIVETVPVQGADTREIVRVMLGTEAAESAPITPGKPGKAAITVHEVSLAPKLRKISLTLHEGEVLGIAGLLGSGRTELLEAIMGIRKPDSGTISAGGGEVTGTDYRGMVVRGFGFTPESRKDAGIVPMLGVDENVVATDFPAVSHGGILSSRRIAQATRRVIERLHIKTASTGTPISTLSGGNQQKVVIGRWVHAGSRVLLLDEPTRGVDVKAKSQIYAIIRELAAEGRAILFVSSEIEELPLVCDRVLVLRDGEMMDEMAAPGIDQDKLLAASLSAA